MREIKFRGKRKDTFEWIIGYYGHKDLSEEHFIIVPTFDPQGSTRLQYFTDHLVDPNTVGQYTGLVDQNNVEICEGDILQHKKHGKKIVEFINGKYVCESLDLSEINEWAEIIGNIHDNTELFTELT
ncbi:YopX family protein [Paenibacillus gallinarum]|uniref:YopX protein domain-containing protein n=1 Tax=Paenibacillus gallinarum TaxID=2762232 RepID=A0ABR8SWN5_9BACL|nr:YopX family protein [Paenibacillus gallinarum]MBD7967744.1 hypothetical protein [Paenibacillus gallinarum]